MKMEADLYWLAKRMTPKSVEGFEQGSVSIHDRSEGTWKAYSDMESGDHLVFDVMMTRQKLGLEPSCIAEPDEEAGLQEAYERMNKPKQEYSAYFKDVRHIDTLDVYRVVSLFDCEKHGHAISHAAKKLLLTGARTGGKDVETEVREAIDSLHRWLEMREEDKKCTAQ